jgi:hypothetical protein
VVPSLRVPVPPEAHFLRGATLLRWIQEAQLHGARGVALDGVDRIGGCSAPEAVLTALQAAVQASAGGFTVQPRARLAVLYEPYAEGRQAQDVSIYGYLGGLVPGEPSLLISGLRLGSRFGLVDYLSLERLLAADLDGYSAILAPCALSLPVEAQAKLRTYVEGGGRLVCDFGAGVQQTGSWQVLPEELARLCGIESLGHMQQQAGDLNFSAPTALFPSLVPPLVSQPQVEQKPLVNGQTQQAQGTPLQLKSWTFSGPMVMATLSDDTRAVGIVTAQARSGQDPARFSGLMARPDGPGWAAFCTGSLWARWSPADPAFAVTHGDLWAPRAEYALQQPGLWPGAVEMCAGDGIVWLLNCTGQPVTTTVLARDADCALYAGTFAWLPLAAGGTTTAELLVDLPAGRLTALARRPVQVLPLAGGAFAHLEEYGPGEIRLELAGPGGRLILGLNHQRTFNPGGPLQVMVSVSDGDYAVAPGSRHRVQIDAGFGQRTDTVQQADDRGVLTFPVSGAHAEVALTPAP